MSNESYSLLGIDQQNLITYVCTKMAFEVIASNDIVVNHTLFLQLLCLTLLTLLFYPRILEMKESCQNTNRLHYLLNLATIKQDNLAKVYKP